MENNPKIKLFFFSLLNEKIDITYYKLSFANDIMYDLTTLEATYDIPDYIFKYGKEKKTISIEFFNHSKEYMGKIDFPIDYCLNNIYIQINGNCKGSNFDLIFRNGENLNVQISDKKFTEFDTAGTKDRKKLTILNFAFNYIMINNKQMNLNDFFANYNGKFLQFSINLTDYKIIVQPYEELAKPELHLLMENKITYEKIKSQLDALFSYKGDYKKKYYALLREYKGANKYDFKMNLSTKYFEDYINEYKIEFNEPILNYSIYCAFYNGYFKYSKNKKFFHKIVDEYEKHYKQILSNNKLNIYEKILLFSKISRILFHCETLNSLNKINIKYFIVSECKENTIIGKAKKLYDDFVKNLTEDSKVFPYLLNLDSGTGYYENEMVYTFDMTNLELMKFHLSEICPKIIVFYNYQNTIIGNIHKNVPCMGVNLYTQT